MNKLTPLSNNRRGAASLITVIFISIILTILVLGFVRLAVNEQRQAADDDLTTRAFYSAEAGLVDAKRAIRAHLSDASSIELNADNCQPPVDPLNADTFSAELSTSAEFDTGYSCMLIDMTPPNFEALIEKGRTKQIDLRTEGNAAFSSVTIEWHIDAPMPEGDGENPALRAGGDASLPPEAGWQVAGGSAYPAMLRSYLFSYPSSGISRASMDGYVNVAFLNPASPGTGTINYAGDPDANLGVYDAACDAGASEGTYVCSQTYTVNGGAGGRNHVLRMTSLYRGSHVRVTLRNSAGVIQNFDGVQALVDVTGRAADVYRRIETRLDISGNLASLLPDQAILSADDICKNLIVPNPGNADSYKSNNCFQNQ